jgi:hypothetical protein
MSKQTAYRITPLGQKGFEFIREHPDADIIEAFTAGWDASGRDDLLAALKDLIPARNFCAASTRPEVWRARFNAAEEAVKRAKGGETE